MILIYPSSLQKLPEHVGTKEENPLKKEDKTNPLVIPGWVKIGYTWLGKIGFTRLDKTKTNIGSPLRIKHSNKHNLLGEQQSVIFMCTKSVISKLFAIF